MRKLIVAEHISLDGVVQSPGGPEEDLSGEFRLGGWTVPYVDDAVGQDLQELFSQPFELLLGRRTYEIFAAYWPRVPVDSKSRAIADLFNSVPKHVVETHSTTVDVGRMASEAKVKTLVLSHLLPGSNRNATQEFPDTAYIEGVRQHFSGQVIIGRDEMVL